MGVLVTGGAGFIGSHLVSALIDAGEEVFVLDDLSTGSQKNVAHIQDRPLFHLVTGSITDEAAVEDLVARCDRIFHLAAVVGVALVMQEPVRTIETNVRGTEVVLRCAARQGRRVLLASSSEVYGTAQGPLCEDSSRVQGSTRKRRWAYACTKALDEFLALAYHEERALPVVIARIFNTVGPRQTGRYGMVVPRFVGQALRGQPITVHGDGSQRRCFCHVHDTVDALQALMGSLDTTGDVFNVGNPEETSILALAQRVREASGSDSPVVCVPYEEAYGPGFEDMASRLPDIAKIGSRIGWKPRFGLDTILRDVIRHEEGRS